MPLVADSWFDPHWVFAGEQLRDISLDVLEDRLLLQATKHQLNVALPHRAFWLHVCVSLRLETKDGPPAHLNSL